MPPYFWICVTTKLNLTITLLFYLKINITSCATHLLVNLNRSQVLGINNLKIIVGPMREK